MPPPPYGHAFLGRLLGGAGVAHVVAPQVFDTVVPRWLPGPARFWTLASGVAELSAAVLLAVPRTRRVGGLLAAAVFLAVFPANVDMAWRRRRRPAAFVACLLRLPLQLPLVLWAWRVARPRPE